MGVDAAPAAARLTPARALPAWSCPWARHRVGRARLGCCRSDRCRRAPGPAPVDALLALCAALACAGLLALAAVGATVTLAVAVTGQLVGRWAELAQLLTPHVVRAAVGLVVGVTVVGGQVPAQRPTSLAAYAHGSARGRSTLFLPPGWSPDRPADLHPVTRDPTARDAAGRTDAAGSRERTASPTSSYTMATRSGASLPVSSGPAPATLEWPPSGRGGMRRTAQRSAPTPTSSSRATPSRTGAAAADQHRPRGVAMTSDLPHPSPLRRLPLPCSEPPFDDELSPGRGGRRHRSATVGVHRRPRDQVNAGSRAHSPWRSCCRPVCRPCPSRLRTWSSSRATAARRTSRTPTDRSEPALPAPRTWAVAWCRPSSRCWPAFAPQPNWCAGRTEEVYEEISGRILPGGVGTSRVTPWVVRSCM